MNMDFASSAVFSYFTTSILLMLMFMLWYYHHVRLDSYPDRKLPPGSFGLPIIGETIALAIQRVNFFRERHQKYGNVFKTHLFFRPTIRVCGAENIKTVLKGENTLVTSFWPKSVRCVFGRHSLALSTSVQHRNRKRDVTRALTGSTLNVYRSSVGVIIARTLREWSDSCSVKLSEACHSLSLKLILFSLYGNAISEDEMAALSEPISQIWDNLLCLPVYFPGTGYYKVVTARKQLADHFAAIAERVNQRRDETDLHPILENILNEGNNNGKKLGELEKEKLTDTTIELVLAGRMTVSTFLLSSFILLDKHPEVVKKIQRELVDCSMENADLLPLREIGAERMESLEYLDQVLNEILRVLPPVGGGYRKVLRPFELEGYYVPEGWAVAFSIRETHDLHDLPEPSEFNPDRWSRNNDHRPDRDRFSFVPFGAGCRSCPGKQYAKLIVKLFLIELVRSHKWSTLDEYRVIHYPAPKTEPPIRVSFLPTKLSFMQSELVTGANLGDVCARPSSTESRTH